MKTIYDEMFEFDNNTNCIILDDVDFIRRRSNIRVYLPTYMTNIQKGNPTKTILQTKGKMVFVSEVKPSTTSNTLTSQNYMTVNNLNDSHIKNYVNSLGDPRYRKFVVNKGTKLKGYFKNNKLNQLYSEVLLSDGHEIHLQYPQPL